MWSNSRNEEFVDIENVDITNQWLLGTKGDNIVMLNHNAAINMTRIEALVLAAWLVAMADEDNEFKQILEKVQNT